MYFFVDSLDQSVIAFATMGNAAKHVLSKMGAGLNAGDDPVKKANECLGDRGVILNLSGVFDSIAKSDNQAAQELAKQYGEAVEQYFTRK